MCLDSGGDAEHGYLRGSVRAAAPTAAQDEAHDQDYSKNKKYQQGLREGQNDSKHNRDHYKKRHFKKDEDQRAYESGYQRVTRPINIDKDLRVLRVPDKESGFFVSEITCGRQSNRIEGKVK